MSALQVIVIFDIGKTNKKVLLFNRAYNLVYEEETVLPTSLDEDGVPSEDLAMLSQWVINTFDRILADSKWEIVAVNFTTYGASLVHIDKEGRPLTALYSYFKEISPEIASSFYEMFGLSELFSLQTGSPTLQMLNSGLQLYWFKYAQPEKFSALSTTLHLPQYLSFLFTGERLADMTSIGCHTGLWDYHHKKYHDWTEWEGLMDILPEPTDYRATRNIAYKGKSLMCGIGIHDSSASLLPFILREGEKPGILSTGTWNIFLLPFFSGVLEEEDYAADCLYYLLGKEQPVAAARLPMGQVFDHYIEKFAIKFDQPLNYYRTIPTDIPRIKKLLKTSEQHTVFDRQAINHDKHIDAEREQLLSRFEDYETAYYQLMADLLLWQKDSMERLTRQSPTEKIYITGGFSRNELFREGLGLLFPDITFTSTQVSQGTALGAALALHDAWNRNNPLPVISK